MEQRSEEWFEQRLGRFTSSEIYKLMGVKGLGETGKTYAFEKAIEVLFGRDEEWNVETWDMKRGKEQEEEAFEIFAKIMAKKFIKVEKASFFPKGDNAGASPDGLVGKDATLEIKCPRPEKFFKIVKGGISAIESKWIDQMQHAMDCTNSKRTHFVVFLKWKGEFLHHEIIIERDQERIDLINEQIEQAVTLRDQYVDELRVKMGIE